VLEADAGTPAISAEDHDWPLQDTSLAPLPTERSMSAEASLNLLQAIGKRAPGIQQDHQERVSCDCATLPARRRDIREPSPSFLEKETAQISPRYTSPCNPAHDVHSPPSSILAATLSAGSRLCILREKNTYGPYTFLPEVQFFSSNS